MSETVDVASSTRRILVIDDDPETVRVLRTWFAQQPYDIVEAPDGEAGLAEAAAQIPDLILLDLRMPGDDGLAVAQKLKTASETRAVPVILLTACRDVNQKVEAFEAGADDYITKPFEFEEMDARVRAMLRRSAHLAGLQSKIRDLQLENSELERLLTLDEKTGLRNFREFRRKLREEWLRAERYGNPLSLVLFDLDDFKRFNDTHGHQAGDRALMEFATLVAGGARATDVAARYGGEEFAVVLPHTDARMAHRVADRIRAAVDDFVFLAHESPSSITVSAGVATYPETPGVDSVDRLVRASDRAMYRAKDLGKNRVEIAGPGDAAGPVVRAPTRVDRGRHRGDAPRR